MASLLASPPETFTGSNGATPNTANTVLALNENSGSYTIQGNQARIRTGTTQYNRTSARLVVAARADTEVVFDWVIPASNTVFAYFYMRHSTTSIDTQAGYYFTLEQSQMTVGRASAYVGTDITTVSYSGRTVGTILRTRIAVFGNTLKARTWPAANAESTGTWDISVTDTNITAAGYYGMTVSSAVAGAQDFFFDNLNAFDTETPSQATLGVGGTLTAGGELRKSMPKRFLASMTPAGVVMARRIVVRGFTGSMTATGAFAKRANKVLGGTVTPAGDFAKRANKVLTGSITASATLRRRVVKRLGGTISTVGTLLAVNAGRTFGVPGIVVVKIIKAAAVRARIRRG